MRRARILAVLAVWLLSACSTAVPSPTPALAPPSPVADSTEPPVPTPHGSDAASRCDFAASYPYGPEAIDLYGSAYQPNGGTDGGQMTVLTTHPINGFDPLGASTPGDQLLYQAVWRGLARMSDDYKAIPDLARVVPQPVNGLVATAEDGSMTVMWCLKPDVAWSDGVPVTCRDFQYTLTWLDEVRPERVATFGDVSAVDCPNDHIVVFHYPALFASYYGRPLPPLPEHALAPLPAADLRAGTPFATDRLTRLPTSGPFRFATVDPGRRYDLVRNTGYRGTLGQPPHLDGLTIEVNPDAEDAIATFRTGGAQLVDGLDPVELPDLAALGLNDSIAAAPSLVYDSLRFNLSSAAGPNGAGGCSLDLSVAARGSGCPTSDLSLREAIREALDLDQIAAAMAPPGGVQRTNSIVPQAWFYTDLPLVPADPAAAQALLQTGGWTDANHDGVIERHGLQARVELCTTDTRGHLDAVRLIVAQLAAIGVVIVPHVVPESELILPYANARRDSPCAISRGNFDIALMPLTTSLEPADFQTRYGSQFVEPVGLNDGRVDDPAIDAALAMTVGTLDFGVIKDGMAQLQRAVLADAVEIPLGSRKSVVLVAALSNGGTALGNYFQSPSSSDTWNAEDWYLIPARTLPPRSSP